MSQMKHFSIHIKKVHQNARDDEKNLGLFCNVSYALFLICELCLIPD